MEYSEDHIALAAEYALGTLDADERAQVETMMGADPEFTTVVQAWEFRLGVLNQMVGSVEPPAELWDRIKAAIAVTGQQQQAEPQEQQETQEPQVWPEPPPIAPFAAIEEAMAATVEHGLAPPVAPPPVVEAPPPVIDETNVVRLERRVRSYRNIAM